MRRILVVDDDRHTRLAIGIWLKQCGFWVAIADGGESGLTALNDGTARRVPGPSKNSRSDGARLWNRPYTLWRADRPAICGRNAVVH